MREIKFRQWDGKTMLDWMCISQTAFNNQSVGAQRQATQSFTPLMYSVMTRRGPDWILMQYTGLKDKSGVEIYEGDIISHPNGDSAVVVWSAGHCGFRADYLNGGDGNLAMQIGDKGLAVVIGNIYQHPELIETEAK